MSAQHTPGPVVTVVEALVIVAALQESADAARRASVGKIHNAKLSLLDEASTAELLASRIGAWANAEQERLNYAQGAGVRALMAGRAAARAKAGKP